MVSFLLYDHVYKEHPELVILRFCRIIFGLTCSSFLLNSTISANLKQFNLCVNPREFTFKFIRDLYVDHSSSSFNVGEDTYSFYKRAESILVLAQFNLCKCRTNDIKFKKQIQANESVDSSNTVLLTRKVLGVNWGTETNTFCFYFQKISILTL